jgi:hypothetical protein
MMGSLPHPGFLPARALGAAEISAAWNGGHSRSGGRNGDSGSLRSNTEHLNVGAYVAHVANAG